MSNLQFDSGSVRRRGVHSGRCPGARAPHAVASLLFAAIAAAQSPQTPQTPQAPQAPAADKAEPRILVPGVKSITIGGQYRLRYEGFFNYDLSSSAASDANNDFFTQRTRLNFGMELGDRLGLFFQLQDAREWGEEASTTDDAADGLDMHQAYVDVRNTPGIGGKSRLGRQEINLGDQRLVGALDWKSQARALDGLLHSWEFEDGGSLLLWAVQAREVLNNLNDDARFAGVQCAPKIDKDLTSEFYVMYLQDDGATVGTTQNRFTLGTRDIWKTSDSVELGIEVATQFGKQAGNDIPIGDTYAGHVHAQFSFEGELHPRLTAACDLASGDDPNTTDVERFNNLFPTAHAHWGMMDLAQWENLFNPWARIAIEPCAKSNLSLTFHNLRAMEATDAFRGPSATLSAGSAGISKEMGNEIDLLFTRNLELVENAKTAVQVGYGVFLPGSGAKAAAGDDDMAHFFYAQFDVRF